MIGAHGAPVRWAGLLDGLLEAVCLIDPFSQEIVAANARVAALTGMPAAGMLGRRLTEFAATPADLALWDDLRDHAAEWVAGEGREHETLLVGHDGTPRPLTMRVTRLPPGAGEGLWLVAMHDHSEERRMRAALDEKVAELQATMESTADGLLVTDLTGRILNFNRRFGSLWSLPDALTRQRDDEGVRAWMRRSVSDAAAWLRLEQQWGDSALLESNDLVQLLSGLLLEVASRPLISRGSPIGRVTAFRDLTERQRILGEIERLTRTDSLTGLANRGDFAERMRRRLGRTGPAAQPAALLLVNLDRFRTVNESLGAAAADQVLAEVAHRLHAAATPDDVIARLTGDEFVMGLAHADARAAEAAARRVLGALEPAFDIDGTRFSLTCSIGIALAPTDGTDPESLLRHADAALRRAKEAGRATYRFFQPRRNVDLRERLEIDHAMREGLERGDFRIEVQPQFELAGGALTGVEALARWRHPRLGEISPGRFVPLAEDSGFIVDLGQWVLETAVTLAAGWWRAGSAIPISVNVSALQFRRPDFVDRVADVLDRAGLPAAGLELELTESILVGDACESLARLKELHALGVRLALDDFGTGYSSLAVLKRFPISRLKIDRSFVAALPDDESDAAIVHAIAGMARALRMTVVAEGVETEAQRAFLQRAGCHVMQGYLRSRPLPVADFEARRRSGQWLVPESPPLAAGAASGEPWAQHPAERTVARPEWVGARRPPAPRRRRRGAATSARG